MARYRILTIDGGGLRGVIATTMLKRIVSEPGLEGFLDQIDLVAGTSTGGLIALGIANKTPLATIHNLYVERGDNIFKDSLLDNIRDLGKIAGADYDIRRLKKELIPVFGTKTLGELKTRVLIPSFDLDNGAASVQDRTWKPKLWHNFVGPGSDRQASVVDVGLYTSAAPTYFASVDGYIDGGVFANNPSMCALGQAQDVRYSPTPKIDEIDLFSLGTGVTREYIPKKKLDWGYAQWAKPLVTLIMDGVAGIADYQCQQLLREHYHRLSPVLNKNYRIDDHRQMGAMVAFAESLDLSTTFSWLKSHWN
jgi:hypothetical protein